MTEDEAEKAAATFEFPGYRAEVAKFYRLGDATNEVTGINWRLKVTKPPSEDTRYFTIEEWQRAWQNMQAGRVYFDDGRARTS